MTRPQSAHRPPMRNGVSASAVSLVPGPWVLLIDFLCDRFPRVSRADWHSRLLRGDVLDAAGLQLGSGAAYQTHSLVYYFREPAPELPIPFEEKVLYRDAHLLIADKPHFLPVMPSGRYLQETLLVRLKRKFDLENLVPVHRIDRDTAGLVMFSLNPQSRGAYVALFRNRQVQKNYEAIAAWRDEIALPMTLRNRIESSDAFMCMQVTEGEANSETYIELLERHGEWARYGLSPLTGRRHQLRVQMAKLGMPILHDNIYPTLSPEWPVGVAPDFSQPLQLLARTLAFDDPMTGKARRFESALRLSMPTAA
jgi:tRNA pseudouridine32 synthase/23S rRNA pseudouridine746 synthase